MKLNFWISLPLSMICLVANGQGTTTTSIATSTPAAAVNAPATATSTVKVEKKEEDPKIKLGLIYDADYSLQAETQADGSRSQTLGHTFMPTMGYGEYSLMAVFPFEQDLVATSSGNKWSDPSFILGKKAWELGQYLKLAPSGSLMLPMTDSTRNEVGLLYNLGAALKFSANTKNMGMDSLSLAYQASVTKNFLSFDTNAKSGSPNRSYRLRNRFDLGYDITDSFSFFNRFDFDSNYSVNGVVTNSFATTQSFGYQINSKVSASLSHSNGGSYLKSDTYENNLKLYNKEDSSYGLGLELVL